MAQNEQVHGALLRHGSLDPHVHRASHGLVDQLAGATPMMPELIRVDGDGEPADDLAPPALLPVPA